MYVYIYIIIYIYDLSLLISASKSSIGQLTDSFNEPMQWRSASLAGHSRRQKMLTGIVRVWCSSKTSKMDFHNFPRIKKYQEGMESTRSWLETRDISHATRKLPPGWKADVPSLSASGGYSHSWLFAAKRLTTFIFYQCLPDLANLWANLIKDHQSQSMSLEDPHWLGNHWEVQSPKIIQNLSLLQLCYMWNSEKRLVLFCFICLGRATLLFIHNVPIKAVYKWSQIPCSNSTLILIHIPWGDITLDISRLYLSLKLQPWIHWHSATFQNTSKH